jgi:hypothetical protein
MLRKYSLNIKSQKLINQIEVLVKRGYSLHSREVVNLSKKIDLIVIELQKDKMKD